MNPKWIRRLGQLVVWGLLLLAPVLGMWGVSVTTRYGGNDMARRYTSIGRAVSERMDGWFGDPPAWLSDVLVGSTWSIRIGGMEITDPLGALSVLAGGNMLPVQMALGAGLVVILYFGTGRAVCGYLCPYGTLARLVNRVRKPLERAGWVHSLQPPKATRYVLLVAVVLAPLFSWSLAGIVLPYLAIARVPYGLVFGGWAAAAGLVGALLLSDVLLWDHGVCRHICPSGALQRLFGSRRVVHLVAFRGKACQKGCNECIDACWLGLDPRSGRVSDDCDACGRCMPDCPQGRLGVQLRPGPVTAAVASVLLLFLSGCAAPEVVSAQAPWSSPFMPPADDERLHDVHFVEHDIDGSTLGVGVADVSADEQGLRLLLEKEPGSTHTGPLTVRLDGWGGSTTLAFATANAPRSVARPSMYEASVRLPGPTRLTIIDGPHVGAEVKLPSVASPLWGPLAPSACVVLLWGVWFRTRPVRNHDVALSPVSERVG
jgi:ferredoxin-type protein NapH